MNELQAYLGELCERQNLSFRRASMKANLAPETIGKIVNREPFSVPRPETLRLIAEHLGGDYDLMMRLAGYLPPLPERVPGELGPEARKAADEILELWRRVEQDDPELLRQLQFMARLQVEMVKATLRQREPSEQQTREEA